MNGRPRIRAVAALTASALVAVVAFAPSAATPRAEIVPAAGGSVATAASAPREAPARTRRRAGVTPDADRSLFAAYRRQLAATRGATGDRTVVFPRVETPVSLSERADIGVADREDQAAILSALGEARVTTTPITAAAVMTDSLFGAGARAEVPPAVMAELANLFLYDVDFVRDVRAGDRFEIVYEAFFDAGGHPVGTGDILFAAMTWRGGQHAKGYYRFEADRADGEARYFDIEGASARRVLMKTPIEGARVTSRFGPRRHPTLGYTKAHKGVDFGARSGTPIMAAGDGTVVRAGAFGSYGNFLLIRHTNGFETAYAHLRGFADRVRKGARVRQGEVVAYVGSTGRSTGPHLHYEVREGGKHVNPMTLDVATGAVLDGESLAAFQTARRAADQMRGRPLAVATGD